MSVSCPFSSVEYLQGLSNIGVVDIHPYLPFSVLRRTIPGTRYQDGVGPWPYRWISHESDIEVFREGFRHLVTLCVVTHPGWEPSASLAEKVNIRPLKAHYGYNPEMPAPALSKRARKRLAVAERNGRFEMISSTQEQLVIVEAYEELVKRRQLTDGFFDMPKSHMASIARIKGSLFFRVNNAQGLGAIACGVIIGEFLQMLHIIPTEYGLTWNAAYLMMFGLQNYVRRHNLTLLTGGMPAGGSAGLQIFKQRWTNTSYPVNMLCICNDPVTAGMLTEKLGYNADYFPNYRHG
ncbi:MAG: hypothetical protein AB7C90_03405 [Bacteroidales bacterium]